MDANTINTLVGALGFPIVMCFMLYRSNLKQSEQHAEEMRKITEAVNNNTLAITKLVEKLNHKEGE